jgi:hypothetical protein
MKRHPIRASATLFVALILLAACSGGGDGGGAPAPVTGNTAPIAANDVATTRMNIAVEINVLANGTEVAPEI